LLGTSNIAVYPGAPRFRVDYNVLLDLSRLDGVLGGPVTLRARWIVASGRDGHALAVSESRVEQPVASPSWEDLVAAYSAALGVVTQEIAAKLATLPALPAK
jgi:uncharacterized protein